ncbi:DUF4147 domain-containing protein [Rhizobium sp. CB3090]|uniref:DUF4147 domain-containing protein n=1 Tax=Rhizobium sp. CB3090 TaxID=3039156 RepID=UPI0024B18476|nr:DUF4147 domain-containing protein [Rhizobium sp. CB3090]WFU10897.1 DUF4147 domain-containing protein [Rhizobium sp. CB3090]
MSHPVPDDAGLRAVQRIQDMAHVLREDDLVVALISCGGSALLPALFGGLTRASIFLLKLKMWLRNFIFRKDRTTTRCG